ncbi:MAG: hypothetical protein FJW86_12260 [Actinobacteria bacterium]|nr:hypothetical protein [Actinomycetota bacterium]
MKRCSKCGETKPFAGFYRARACADGHRPECKACFAKAQKARYLKNPQKQIERVRAWREKNPEKFHAYQRQYRAKNKPAMREGHLRRTFGLTQADYDEMLRAQSGGCAICGDKPKAGESFHVDHCEAGVRGILCVRCNNALGQLREDEGIAGRAVDYLASNGFVLTSYCEMRELAIVRAGGLVKAPG